MSKVVIVMALSLAGCSVRGHLSGEDGLKRQGIHMQGIQTQGIQTQGIQTQGIQTQGIQTQGTKDQGVRWQQVRWHGQAVAGLSLRGTELSGTAGGRPLRGADFIGATVLGTGPGGQSVAARIDGMERDGGDQTGETWLYELTWAGAGGGAVCSADRDGVRRAIPLAGAWDERGAHHDGGDFTFACTSGVLAKCVRWGYRPWLSVGGRSLAAHHQACTRMARADYCGTGTPHTREGTLIDVRDEIGVQDFVSGDGMGLEAAWSPDGAACLSRGRWHTLEVSLLSECPERLALDLSALWKGDGCWLKLRAPSAAPGHAVALLANRSVAPAALW